MKLLVDTHTHTLVSGHAYSTIKEMEEAAHTRGLEALAITEHAPMMPGTCHEFYFQNLKVVPRKMDGLTILFGAELNIMDSTGAVDLEEGVMKQLDILVASIHTPCYGEDQGIVQNTCAYINAMKNPYVSIIGHPDDGRFPIDYEKLVKAAKEHHVLLEVNNSSLRPTSFRRDAKGNILQMLELCKLYGVSITVGSDSHVDIDVGNFSEALKILEQAEFPEELIANTSLEKLEPFLNGYKNK